MLTRAGPGNREFSFPTSLLCKIEPNRNIGCRWYNVSDSRPNILEYFFADSEEQISKLHLQDK